jgi:hypothetical protein
MTYNQRAEVENMRSWRLRYAWILLLSCPSVGLLGQTPCPALAGGFTDPACFASVIELPVRGAERPITAHNSQIDDRSIIEIRFDNARIAPPNAAGLVQVEVLVLGSVRRGTSVSPIVPIDLYVSKLADGTTHYHPKAFSPPISPIVPNTDIDLGALNVAGADEVVIRVINDKNQQALELHMVPRPFGFRTRVSDSFLLIKRFGIHTAERTLGFDPSNFSPAPGVTYGGVYTGRGGAGRFLQPGIGVNVSFLTWHDPATSNTTGQPAQGTTASSVQVGTGLMISFFSDVLQFTLGSNLNVDHHRTYWGVGFSFVNLAERLKGSK